MKKLFLFVLPLFLVSFLANSQNTSFYLEKTFISEKGDSLLYRIMFPENYQKTKKYPLLLFLHGAGERGRDNKLQLVHGASLFAREDIRQKYPAIVVLPQCPENTSWSFLDLSNRKDKNWSFPFYEEPLRPLGLVIELLQKLEMEESIDANRLYVSGLSMGGFGAFDLLARMPDKFAAAAPICGGGNAGVVGLYAGNTNLWIFHGALDRVVPVENSRKMFDALKKWKANVLYTEYPDYDHNSWDAVFADPEYLDWMFRQKRK